MSQLTNLRIKTYPYKNLDVCYEDEPCDVCCAGYERGKDIYVNVIPYELYVVLLNSSSRLFADGICKDGWGTEKCDLTGEMFDPTFLLYLCNKCYEKYFRSYYRNKDGSNVV